MTGLLNVQLSKDGATTKVGLSAGAKLIGRRFALRVFMSRGKDKPNYKPASEIHLSQDELATILGVAFQAGVDACKQFNNDSRSKS